MQVIMSHHDIQKKIELAFDKILKSIEAYVQRGSDWRIKRIAGIQLKMGTYISFKGGWNDCLTDQLKNKKAILNVSSNDNTCFVWHVLASIYPLSQNCNCNL